MDVSRCSRTLAGALLSLLIAGSVPVQAEKEEPEDKVLLAGPMGKSSSASARVTLVIPPRPETTKQPAKPETTAEKAKTPAQQADKQE